MPQPPGKIKEEMTVLGYSNTKDALARHVDGEDKGRSRITTPSGEQEMTIINESGLYSLAFSSKLPTAKKFTRWVTHEVLPSIRQTGQYAVKERCLPTLECPAAFEQKDLSKIRCNWFNYMLTALERKLGITKDNMLHQCYECMKNEGINVDLLKNRYIETTGRVDCSTFEAVCNDREATLELSSILCRNMDITFIKRCM